MGRFICTLRCVMVKPNEKCLKYLCSMLASRILIVLNFVGNVAVWKRFMYFFWMDIATLTVNSQRKKIRIFFEDKRYKFKDSFSTGTNYRNSNIKVRRACEVKTLSKCLKALFSQHLVLCVFFLSSSFILFSLLASDIWVFYFLKLRI